MNEAIEHTLVWRRDDATRWDRPYATAVGQRAVRARLARLARTIRLTTVRASVQGVWSRPLSARIRRAGFRGHRRGLTRDGGCLGGCGRRVGRYAARGAFRTRTCPTVRDQVQTAIR